MLVPHMLEQVLLAQDLIGAGHEVAEQGELLGGEVEFSFTATSTLLRTSSSMSPTVKIEDDVAAHGA